MFPHYQEENKIVNMMVLDLLLRDLRPSSWYKRSKEVPFIAPVIIGAAEYWNFSSFSLKESLKGLL